MLTDAAMPQQGSPYERIAQLAKEARYQAHEARRLADNAFEIALETAEGDYSDQQLLEIVIRAHAQADKALATMALVLAEARIRADIRAPDSLVLNQYEVDIHDAEGHIENAKEWLRLARLGLTPEHYHIDDALNEAGSTLLAATTPDDEGRIAPA